LTLLFAQGLQHSQVLQRHIFHSYPN
jgi:hypothetical protein